MCIYFQSWHCWKNCQKLASSATMAGTPSPLHLQEVKCHQASHEYQIPYYSHPQNSNETTWNIRTEAVESWMKCEACLLIRTATLKMFSFFFCYRDQMQWNQRQYSFRAITTLSKVHWNKHNIFYWCPWPLIWVLHVKSEFLVRNVSRPCALET